MLGQGQSGNSTNGLNSGLNHSFVLAFCVHVRIHVTSLRLCQRHGVSVALVQMSFVSFGWLVLIGLLFGLRQGLTGHALADLEFAMQNRLTFNSQRSACLSSAVIRGIYCHTQPYSLLGYRKPGQRAGSAIFSFLAIC